MYHICQHVLVWCDCLIDMWIFNQSYFLFVLSRVVGWWRCIRSLFMPIHSFCLILNPVALSCTSIRMPTLFCSRPWSWSIVWFHMLGLISHVSLHFVHELWQTCHSNSISLFFFGLVQSLGESFYWSQDVQWCLCFDDLWSCSLCKSG